MRAVKRPSRGVRTRSEFDEEPGAAGRADADVTGAADGEEPPDAEEEALPIFRVFCPDCARPIALLADELLLPEHAVCSSPWNPFGLSVCPGSGRAAADAEPVGGDEAATERDVAVLLTLPAGLDWRTQPFSHAGGPAAPPPRAPRARRRLG